MDPQPTIVLTSEELAEGERAWSAVDGDAPRLLVNISSLNECRRWDDGAYATALRGIRRRRPDVRIGIIGGPGDEVRATALARSVGAIAMVPPLRIAFATVATANVLFTPDTSISHAASAFDKPAVVMMIQGMTIFEPYETRGRNLYSDGPTLESLPVDGVISALDEVLREISTELPRVPVLRPAPEI